MPVNVPFDPGPRRSGRQARPRAFVLPMRNLALAMFVGALALGHPSVSDAQLVLYDDFSSGLIDPTRWFGTDAQGGGRNPTTEAVRVIKSNKLELRLDQYGLNNSDTGATTGLLHLRVVKPAPITTMQATVRVRSGEAEGCSTNISGVVSAARAQVEGNFFNDGSSAGPGDLTGDIIATVGLVVHETAGNIIQGVATRCSNAACSSSSHLAGSPVNFTATWIPNKPQTLTVTWDAANNQFIFSAKPSGGSAEMHTLPYTLSDSAPPGGPTKALRIFHTVANCNGNQRHAFMDATFDNVMVNP